MEIILMHFDLWGHNVVRRLCYAINLHNHEGIFYFISFYWVFNRNT